MRELRFRGKSVENGEWIVGMNLFLCCNKERTEYAGWMTQRGTHVTHTPVDTPDGSVWHHSTEGVEVDVETIGQYTGLKDRDGKEIFEGDIVEGEDFNKESGYGVIRFSNGAFIVESLIAEGTFYTNYYAERMTVIGNIHDNPELLEKEETKAGGKQGE